METRRFKVDLFCVSCKGTLEKAFKKYSDIEISVNTAMQILKVTTDFEKHSNEEIEKICLDAGVKVESTL